VPAVIPYVRDIDIEYGRVDSVSPLIRRVVANNPSKFTYLGTGTYLIGHGDVAVIDPGPDLPEHVEAIMSALEDGERVTDILVTHTHIDHSPAVPMVQERTGAPSWGYGPHGALGPDDPTDRVVFGDEEADGSKGGDEPREGADTGFSPDHAIRDGDVISGPGWTIEAVYTPGHTSNHLCFALREERALFTGDHVMGWSTSVIGPPDGDLGRYLASLEKLLPRDDQIFWPTHGPPVTDPKPFVRAFIEHRADRERQLVEGLAAGRSTIAELVPAMYADVAKELWRPAGASTYALLLKLVAEHRVRTDDDPPRRTSRYFLA
jgi:glyoxylase-like metal-dependent hydrolase (beta-lactamase superfamily II)